MLIGLSAPVSGILTKKLGIGNPIFSISGDSSRGKTTAGILAASTVFCPKTGSYDGKDFLENDCTKTGGVMSWNATANSIISRLRNFAGVVAVIDELSKFGDSDISKIVYSLSDGVDKGRLDKDLSSRETKLFQTSIMCLGEERLTDRCKNDRTGVRMRIMEIDGNMTENAEHAERITNCCYENYGHAAMKLARWICDNGGEKMVWDEWKKSRKKFRGVSTNSSYMPRTETGAF